VLRPPAGRHRTAPGQWSARCTQGPVGPESNATFDIGYVADGWYDRDYMVSTAVIGDPAPGQAKAFHAAWSRGSDPTRRPIRAVRRNPADGRGAAP